MYKYPKFLRDLEDNRNFKRSLVLCLFALFVWCTFVTLLHQKSMEALVSSIRLMGELFIAFLALRYNKLGIVKIFLHVVIALSTINGLFVAYELLEGAGCIATNLNQTMLDFWRIPLDDASRKIGFFNGFQMSSYFSFLTLVLLVKKRDYLSVIVMAINVFPVLFGARTFMLFLPFFFVVNWRVFVGTLTLLSLLVLAGSSCKIIYVLESHLLTRILPSILVMSNLDPQLDWSSKDTMRHYKIPSDFKSLLIGNGYPRYSSMGGKDPTFSRWILQTGVPGLVLIFSIVGMVLYRILRKGGGVNLAFFLALGLSTFKGEIVTSFLIFTTLILYVLADVENMFSVKEEGDHKVGGGS